MIKAVFFDIDGTLTCLQTGVIPQSTIEALSRLRANGIKIFVATGRHRIDMNRTQVRDIPFDGYVTLNGQICLDEKEDVFYDKPIDQEDVEVMADIFARKDIKISIAELDRKYINYLTPKDRLRKRRMGAPKRVVGTYTGNKVYQFMMSAAPEKTDTIVAQLRHCKMTHWPPNGTDIIPIDGGKLIGIQEMLNHYGITREEMMAFGDGENDIEMLQFAHIGVAMGTAFDHVKQCADYVTDSAQKDGIRKALTHFQLL